MTSKPIQSLLYLLIGVSLFYLVRYFYLKPSIKVAQDCPPIVTILADSTPFDLKSMRGQYVLIDFWGSWCTPCRKEAPLVKQFYQDWKDVAFKDGNGLEILSIAIEGNRRDWDLAVKEEKMDWPLHILELDQFHSPLVKSFGVREIPTKILLDAQHHIVAVNQSFPEMAELLTRKKI